MANALGITLPLTRGANGYFRNTTSIPEQVQSNLINLLLTQKGERLMQPTYGSTLKAIVFEPNTPESFAKITAAIKASVQQWMPFISIEDVKITSQEEFYKVQVLITYKILINNITDSITLVF